MTTANSSLNTIAKSELDFILTFNHKTDETPTVRYGASPDHLFIMARRVVAQYPAATWFIVRRSDGVCIAQSKQEGDNVQQEPAQADTALVLPGCVTNMMLRSKSSVQQDGTVVFKFAGTVKSRLTIHAFYVIADERNWGKLAATYTGSGDGYDWKLVQTFNQKGEGTHNVSFEMRDYTKKGENNLEQRIARLVLRNQGATPAKVAKLIMAEIAR